MNITIMALDSSFHTCRAGMGDDASCNPVGPIAASDAMRTFLERPPGAPSRSLEVTINSRESGHHCRAGHSSSSMKTLTFMGQYRAIGDVGTWEARLRKLPSLPRLNPGGRLAI